MGSLPYQVLKAFALELLKGGTLFKAPLFLSCGSASPLELTWPPCFPWQNKAPPLECWALARVAALLCACSANRLNL